MKKLNLIKVSIVVIVIFCGLLHSTVAQAANTEQWRKIHLQHVRPDMLAYWLDSAHQRIPAEYQEKFSVPLASDDEGQLQAYTPKSKTPSKLQLSTPSKEPFEGLLSADNSKHNLWIFSTQEIFNKTQKIVEQLNHQIPQIELTLEVVVGNTDTLKKLINGQKSVTVDATQALLNQYQPQIKTFFFPITVKDGFTGSASSFTSTAIVLTNHTSGIGSEIGGPLNLSYLVKRFYAFATPSLGNDKAIQVILAAGSKTKITRQTPPSKITDAWFDSIAGDAMPGLANLNTVCSIKDNQTQMIGGLQTSSKESGGNIINQNTVWFISARIIK